MQDPLAFRQALGRFPTGVTVVTARNGDGRPCGMTVNSFTSVSLDPPLVLVCIDRAATCHGPMIEAGTFAVSVLTEEQSDLAARFAVVPSESRFQEVDWRESPTGDPVLEGCAAWLSCTLEASYPAGDHSILVGRVEELGLGDRDALVFYRGGYRSVRT